MTIQTCLLHLKTFSATVFVGFCLITSSLNASAATLSNTPFSAFLPVDPDPPGQDSGTLTGGTPSGGFGTWNVTTGTNQYMNAVTRFAADLSTVGDKLVVKFDFTLAQDVNNDNGNDFRFSLFDTDAGPEGMEVIQLARLGNQGGFNNSMLKVRIDQTLAPINSGTTPSYGNAYAPGGGPSTFGNPLWKAGDVHTFTTTIERVGSGPFATTHVMTWEWMNSAGTTSMSLDYRDSNGSVDGAINAGDTWIGGLNKINGFGLTIFSKDPFDADGLGGSGTISNFSVTGTPFAVPEPSSAALLAVMGCCTGIRRHRRL